MDRKTIFQLVAFVAASYIAAALFAWALITAIKYVKEHHAMCICPTTELPAQVASTESTVIAELMEKLKEAGTYLELHHPVVTERIKALGVEMPAFSFHAPVLVDLRKALDRVAPTVGASL